MNKFMVTSEPTTAQARGNIKLHETTIQLLVSLPALRIYQEPLQTKGNQTVVWRPHLLQGYELDLIWIPHHLQGYPGQLMRNHWVGGSCLVGPTHSFDMLPRTSFIEAIFPYIGTTAWFKTQILNGQIHEIQFQFKPLSSANLAHM